MRAFRIVVMPKPGVLDAPGQAVKRGLDALGYKVGQVRMGKVIEMTLPEGVVADVQEMCSRFLANPLVETWTIEEIPCEAAR